MTYSVLAGLEPWTALARGGRSGRGFPLCQRLDPSQAPPASGYSKCSPRYLARTGGYDWPSGRLRVLYCSCCLESDAALGLCGWSGLRALHEADFHARACWGRWPRTATHVTQSHAESASTKHHRREPSSARRRPLRPPLPPPSSLFPLPSPLSPSSFSPVPISHHIPNPDKTTRHVPVPSSIHQRPRRRLRRQDITTSSGFGSHLPRSEHQEQHQLLLYIPRPRPCWSTRLMLEPSCQAANLIQPAREREREETPRPPPPTSKHRFL